MSAPLPVRDGVGSSRVRLPAGPWTTVLEFLAQRFPAIDASIWMTRMQQGDVVDENGTRVAPGTAYRSGITLYYYRELAHETPIPFVETVLYQDNHIVVADKPHFLPVMPAGRFLQETLLVRLKRKLKLDFLVPLHRIDRETAGLVLFSVKPETRALYHALFEKRRVLKIYEALAPSLLSGVFPMVSRSRVVVGEPFFRMRESDGEPNAETHIDLLETHGAMARYRLTPITGRKHQLRLHMASLGIPIVNDAFYPTVLPQDEDYSRPLQLIARTLAFDDPITGTSRRFDSALTLAHG